MTGEDIRREALRQAADDAAAAMAAARQGEVVSVEGRGMAAPMGVEMQRGEMERQVEAEVARRMAGVMAQLGPMETRGRDSARRMKAIGSVIAIVGVSAAAGLQSPAAAVVGMLMVFGGLGMFVVGRFSE